MDDLVLDFDQPLPLSSLSAPLARLTAYTSVPLTKPVVTFGCDMPVHHAAQTSKPQAGSKGSGTHPSVDPNRWVCEAWYKSTGHGIRAWWL